MKRTIAVAFALATTFASGTVAVAGATTAYHESLCQARPFMCLDKYKSIGANGEYVGPRRADGGVPLQPAGHRRRAT